MTDFRTFKDKVRQFQELQNFMEERVDKWLLATEVKYSYIDKFNVEEVHLDNLTVTLIQTDHYDPDERWDIKVPMWVVEFDDYDFGLQINHIKLVKQQDKERAEKNKVSKEKRTRRARIADLKKQLNQLLEEDK